MRRLFLVMVLISVGVLAQVKLCDNSTFPNFKSCKFVFLNRASLEIRGLRGLNVFLFFEHVEEVFLEDIEINVTDPKLREFNDVTPTKMRPIACLHFGNVSHASVTSARLTGTEGMSLGCLMVFKNSNVTVVNSSFSRCGCKVSATVELISGTAYFRDVNISNGMNGYSGGSIIAQESSFIDAQNLRITDSYSGEDGGSICLHETSVMIAKDIVILNSQCRRQGCAVMVASNAVFNASNVMIRNSSLSSKIPTWMIQAPKIIIPLQLQRGGAIQGSENATVILTHALISGGYSSFGGCLSLTENAQMVLSSVVVDGCVASEQGNVFHTSGSNANVAVSCLSNVSLPCDGDTTQRCKAGDVWWGQKNNTVYFDERSIPSACYAYIGENIPNRSCLVTAAPTVTPNVTESNVLRNETHNGTTTINGTESSSQIKEPSAVRHVTYALATMSAIAGDLSALLLLQVVLAVQRLMECEGQVEDLPWPAHPTQLRLGPDERDALFAGAVVADGAIVAVGWTLHYAVDRISGGDAPWVAFPSSAVRVHVFFFNGIVTSGVFLPISGTASLWRGLGAVLCAVYLAVLGAAYVHALRGSSARAVFTKAAAPLPTASLWSRATEPGGSWASTDGFCRAFGFFFRNFTADRRWYGVVEYIVPTALVVVSCTRRGLPS